MSKAQARRGAPRFETGPRPPVAAAASPGPGQGPPPRLRLTRALLNDQSGFTLVEVIISLVILTFISLGIYQLTSESFKLRQELSDEADFYNAIRMSMDIVQRDVALLYSPILMQPTPQPSATPGGPQTPGAPPATGSLPPPTSAQDLQAMLSTEIGQTTTFWEPAMDASAIRPSRFQGTDSKMSFISASHIRIYKDSPESDFAAVTYELGRDEGNEVDPSAMKLVKTENADAFDGDDRRAAKFAQVYPLLHGIKQFRIRYCQIDRTTSDHTCKWSTSWDSDKEDQKNQYPDMVEITLEVVGPSKLDFTGVYKMRPEAPLHGLDPST